MAGKKRSATDFPNITRSLSLSHRLKVNYVVAKKHLVVLENEGILRHIQYGRVRLYKLNEGSQKIMALQDLVKTWNIEEKSRFHARTRAERDFLCLGTREMS